MSLKKDTEEKSLDLYLQDWPLHYHELSVEEKLTLLNKKEQSEGDERRLELLKLRYPSLSDTPDKFMEGWMFLRIMEEDHINFLNKNRKTKDVLAQAEKLCLTEQVDEVLQEEWKNLADKYIRSCISSTSYRSKLFGLLQADDEDTAFRIARDIDIITRIVPSRTGQEDMFLPLRKCAIEVYTSILENGETYWNTYKESIKI